MNLGLRVRQGCRWLEDLLLPRPWALRLKLRRVNREYRQDLAKRTADKVSGDELEALRQEWHFEADLVEDEFRSIDTRRLIRTARRLRVPVSGYWKEGRGGGRYLTPDSFVALRTAIRQERKERREARAAWLPWLIALTGLIGTLIGLAASLAPLLARWLP